MLPNQGICSSSRPSQYATFMVRRPPPPHSSLSKVLLRLWGLVVASSFPQKLPEATCSLSGLGSRLHLKTEVKCVVFPSLSQEQPISGDE